MRTLFCSLIVCFSLSSFAQSLWTSKFPIKTTFVIGESQHYVVNELFKIDHLLLGIHSQVESIVSFKVVDTANGGYWLIYSVSINSVKQRKDSSAYIIARLMDGIQLFVYAKNGQLTLDSTLYFNTKKRVASALDSIAVGEKFGKSTTRFIRHLQQELKKEAGLGSLLTPLMIFEVYYSSEVYKKFRVTVDGSAQDILKKPLFSGDIGREWVNTSKDSTVQLNYHFIGDPVPAARYYKSFYEAFFADNNIKKGKHFFPPEMRYVVDFTFRTQPGKSFPSYLFKKNVSEYLLRLVSKIEMQEVTLQND